MICVDFEVIEVKIYLFFVKIYFFYWAKMRQIINLKIMKIKTSCRRNNSRITFLFIISQTNIFFKQKKEEGRIEMNE